MHAVSWLFNAPVHPYTKALLSDFSAFEILFIRFFMAYAALWCLRPKRLVVAGWREEAVYAGMGLTGVTAYQFLENCALHWTNASNVCILVSISPMISSTFFLKA